ncbi:ATP-binding cassette domain-containing protein [Moorella naiadis]|uniref:energy-coupling factor ABC transporter ATP-binding protein n=1 Tax=Moorella naiadis (nom. illeg.) TaxID=3093670 RepID=UPI003D9CA367
MLDPIIKVEDYTFYYPDSQVPALAGINLAVRPGEFVGLTGPTGAGKTTLTLVLNGIIPNFQGGRLAGRVTIAGRDTAATPCARLAGIIGSVFQDPEAQLVAETVEDELAFGLENLAVPREEMQARIAAALEMVGITALCHRSLRQLSGGQKQKVAIAAAVALRPRVLVLDEPTSELDPRGTMEVIALLARLNREYGMTILLIEQKVSILAPLVPRLVCLHQGRIVADAAPRQVLAQEKLVAELGLEVPPVTALFRLLSRTGVYHGDLPLAVDQGRRELDRLLGM